MASKFPDEREAASAPAQAELRLACERLVKITQAIPEEDCCHLFSVGDAAHYVSNHRCLAQAEAGAKLQAIERLTNQPIAPLLADGWEQLSPTQLLDIENVLLSLEPGERTQPLGDQAPAWQRLDEQLFRLAFTAWIKGTNFAVAPRPNTLARRIGVDSVGYKDSLLELRVALTRPITPFTRWPPRVSLWLGEQPSDEVGPPMPRLWVSARVLKFSEMDAAKFGLLPANTIVQELLALKQLCHRWTSRVNEADLPSEPVEQPLEYTICCRCSRTLSVTAPNTDGAIPSSD